MKWNHIILEGFCGKGWDYSLKHDEFCYGKGRIKDVIKFSKRK